MNGQNARVFITLIFGGLFLYISSGFFVPLILAAALALLLHPAYEYLTLRKSWKPNITAGFLTFGVTVLVILPVTLLSIRGVRFLAARFQAWRDSPFLDAPGGDATLLESITRIPGVSALLVRMGDILHMEEADLISEAGNFLKTIGLKVATFVTTALSSIPSFIVGVFLLILGIYFFLADGDRVVRFFRSNSFFPKEQTEEIFQRFKGLCRAVLLASLVSGMVQAAIYFVAGAIARVDDLLVLGFSVFLGSFIPVVGAAPLTFGLAFYFIFTGSKFMGITLLVAALVASVADNFVRPIVLRGGANLHPLIAIVSLFGGLQVFGFAGVFIGPILAGMFFVFLDAYFKSRHSVSG